METKTGDNKRIKLSDENEENQRDKDLCYAQLEQEISADRAVPESSVLIGTYDAELHAVRLDKVNDKVKYIGFEHNDCEYLYPFEAIYLMEMKQLLLNFEGRVELSMEEAYVLLMGEESSKAAAECSVYAFLKRLGFVVKKYHNRSYDTAEEATVPYEKCEQIGLRNILQELEDTEEYQRFMHVFPTFRVVKGGKKLAPQELTPYPLTFELYLHEQGYDKRQKIPPTIRVVILECESYIPKKAGIFSTYMQQKHKVPILLIFAIFKKVKDAFIFHF